MRFEKKNPAKLDSPIRLFCFSDRNMRQNEVASQVKESNCCKKKAPTFKRDLIKIFLPAFTFAYGIVWQLYENVYHHALNSGKE